MTTGHLITHLQLALLGDVYLGQLHDARWEFVPYRYLELASLVGAKHVIVLQVVVVHHAANQRTVVRITHPTVAVDGQVVEAVQDFLREFHALLDLFFLVVVVDSLAHLAAHQLHQLLYEHLLECCCFDVEFLIDGFQNSFVRCFGLAVLDGAREQLLVDDNPLSRRWHFQ